ncbi:hypothetical protein BDR05DRAFT_997247 [Suillus weaverae]|nr:hypothetical protein BDR05DRAFT_997247 [Suillus weaverae]
MKSCLKSPSHSGSATPVDSDTEDGSCQKHVAFGTEQVFQADEWDRTPTEIAQRLSYEDVLELKMIQRSLPRAQQSHDPLSSRPYSGVFLRNVPIPLLPLNPTTVSASPQPRPSYPELELHPNSIFFSELKPHNIPVPPPPLLPQRTSSTPLPPIPSNLPPKKRFAFIPLLDNTTACSSSYNSDTLLPPDTPSLASPPQSPTSTLGEGNFILNSDVDPDVDDSGVDDSYFPRMPTRAPTRTHHPRPSDTVPSLPAHVQMKPRKKLTMPILALAESPPSGMGKKEGYESAHLRDAHGRQKSPSR